MELLLSTSRTAIHPSTTLEKIDCVHKCLLKNIIPVDEREINMKLIFRAKKKKKNQQKLEHSQCSSILKAVVECFM